MGNYEKRVRDLIAAGVKPQHGIDLGHPVMNLGYEPMDIFCASGHKVRYTGNGGYGDELGSYRDILKKGETYSVTAVDMEVGQWVARVHLAEYPGQTFDAVVFEDAPGTKQHDEARLAEIARNRAEMTGYRLNIDTIVDAALNGNIPERPLKASSATAAAAEVQLAVEAPVSIDPVHGGKRKGLDPIYARKTAFTRDPLAILLRDNMVNTTFDAGIPVDAPKDALPHYGRSTQERLERIRQSRIAMARFSTVDVRALSQEIVDDMIPLPDMAGEVRSVIAIRELASDRLLRFGIGLMGLLSVALVIAIFARFFGGAQ